MQKIEDMRITIEDLEALKELNDELEENHVETEKALNEDLGLCCSSGMAPTILIVSQRSATWRSKSSSARSNATKRPAKILRAPSPSSGSLCSTCNRVFPSIHRHSTPDPF